MVCSKKIGYQEPLLRKDHPIVNSHLRLLAGDLFHLDSTATQRTFAGALLWLLCPRHQGTLTRCPSYSSLAEVRAFAWGNIPRANQISVQRVPTVRVLTDKEQPFVWTVLSSAVCPQTGQAFEV